MSANRETIGMEDMGVRLSTLWIFVMFNMIAADILSFEYPGFLEELITGYAGGVQITPGFLLLAAVLMEVPIAMIVLSRVLEHRANRWANIIAAVVTIAFVVGGGSLALHYIFFATIEVACLALIVWYAWRWSDSPGRVAARSHSVQM